MSTHSSLQSTGLRVPCPGRSPRSENNLRVGHNSRSAKENTWLQWQPIYVMLNTDAISWNRWSLGLAKTTNVSARERVMRCNARSCDSIRSVSPFGTSWKIANDWTISFSHIVWVFRLILPHNPLFFLCCPLVYWDFLGLRMWNKLWAI